MLDIGSNCLCIIYIYIYIYIYYFKRICAAGDIFSKLNQSFHTCTNSWNMHVSACNELYWTTNLWLGVLKNGFMTRTHTKQQCFTSCWQYLYLCVCKCRCMSICEVCYSACDTECVYVWCMCMRMCMCMCTCMFIKHMRNVHAPGYMYPAHMNAFVSVCACMSVYA